MSFVTIPPVSALQFRCFYFVLPVTRPVSRPEKNAVPKPPNQHSCLESLLPLS
ncbi:hypothetical protein LptCag_2348 [Leptospirillum ferriphilum]|uniref:Uncharacterized protein n=1 Tax=Leptospirillum ferriphilum TaxID=178606 RepID=A0A094X8P5_9BACT|nr:hypothetical protein LptCag_2348 [Leptospirillum ferriphilum]